jgi:small multidrug resistance pump
MSRLRRAPVWLVLAVAVLAELAGTVSLKASNGLREPVWAVTAAGSLGVALLLLGVLLRRRPLGIVYAVWSGAGAVLSAVAGLARYGERLTLIQLAGLTCVVVGILMLEARGGES